MEKDRLKNENMNRARLGREQIYSQSEGNEIFKQVKLLSYHELTVADVPERFYKYGEFYNMKIHSYHISYQFILQISRIKLSIVFYEEQRFCFCKQSGNN